MRCRCPIPLEFRGQGAYLHPNRITAGRTMATTNPFQFLQQVRAEVAKIVWPTRREVVMTTIMVFIMAALTAVFFSLVDVAIRFGLQTIFNAF
jgi:preprotein translocase subunit SecE